MQLRNQIILLNYTMNNKITFSLRLLFFSFCLLVVSISRGEEIKVTEKKYPDSVEIANAYRLAFDKYILSEQCENLGKSITLKEEAVRILRDIIDTTQWEYSAPLAGLIDAYLYIGDTIKAIPLIDEYIYFYNQYWFKIEDYNTNINCLFFISNWLIDTKQSEKFSTYLSMLEKEFLSKSDYYHLGLLEKFKGYFYQEKQDYEKAINSFINCINYIAANNQLLREQFISSPTDDIYQELLTEYHGPMTIAYIELANAYWLKGDLEKAYEIDTALWGNLIECYGHNSEQAIAGALQSSLHAWTLGDVGDCSAWEEYAFNAIKDEYYSEIVQLPIPQKENYWRKQLPSLRRGLTYASSFPYLSYFATLGYNETLFTKNLLLHSISNNPFNNYDIVWQDIKNTLSTYDIAVDFAIADGDSATNYMAFVLRNDWDTPKCILIDCEKKIRNSYNVNTIWQAIIDSANIQPNDNIYFAPDGVLCDIPIEYLSLPNGKPMNEVYNMYRLSSTRELCFRDTNQTYQTATLYGGLFYDTDSTTIVTESEKYKSTNRDINMMDNSIISQWRANDRANYQYLPYSKIEVNDICEILKGKTIDTKVYTETSGNEESFKALSGNAPDILHVATHGYYITPLDVEVASKIALQRMGVNVDGHQSIIDYSMDRTGLLLAGATLKLQHNTQIQGVEDGILSAKEISTLDLSNVDLAVLSACKTGLGDITSDGVAGLQRGFKCAGVNSILMTLWEVDDAATHLFMSQFYKNLMNGKSKHESLQNAQKFLKEYKQDGEYIYNDYHYWAAFVLLDGI